MSVGQVDVYWAAALCAAAAGARQALQRRAAGARHLRLLPVIGAEGAVLGTGERAGVRGPTPSRVWPRVRTRLRGRLAGITAAPPVWLVPELLLLPVGSAAWQAADSPLPMLAAAAAVVPLRRWRRRRGREREARRRSAAVLELCTALTAEVRSGATPEQALHTVTSRIAADQEALDGLGPEPVARLAAGRYGGDVPAAFELLAELPGGRGAASVAACWEVTSGSGAGLANGLEQVTEALRAERALTEEIEGELAAPRATVAVLAVLPPVGLLLGATLGAHPLDVLLHTPAGLVCLAVGTTLEAAGLAWTARIVRSARGGADSPGHGSAGAGGAEPGWGGAECGISRRSVATRRTGPVSKRLVLR
ncbi:type II secretion system F family protein [Kitasatospora sp. NPDC057015]|uniref:type II secretion system F family protein n=1 Tax=Kitasatospora sp. NPDC057015 TaxID=3346001 RepID=UPI00362ACD33